MKPRVAALLIFLSVLLISALAHAGGCQEWRVGPVENDQLDNGTDQYVHALTAWDPDGAGLQPAMLVAGGIFTRIEGVPAERVAVRDPLSGDWEPLGSGLWGGGTLDPVVLSLAVYNGELIAAGDFTTAAGQPANYIARWDGGSWQPLGSGTDGLVSSMAVYNGELVAAGSFTTAGGQPAKNIARWNGASWQPLGGGLSNPQQTSWVSSVIVYRGELIAGGYFSLADGLPANFIARWNGASWQPLGSGVGAVVRCLTVYNGELIAAGDMGSAGGQSVNRIARWNGATWQSLGSGLGDIVWSVGVYNSELIAAGFFTTAGGQPAKHIARWNGAVWQALGSGLDVPVGQVYPYALMPYLGELIVGGTFNSAGGLYAFDLARWNGIQWSSFGGGTVTSIRALTNFRSRVIAGGEFDQSTKVGQRALDIVSWDGVALLPLGSGVNNAVQALESFKYPGVLGDYELIAGGLFTNAGGVAANYIARWDEDPAGFPPPAWQPMGAGFNNTVFAIERFNGATYAGGAFTASTGSVNRIARWNETTDIWEPLGTGMNGGVYALKEYNGFLYAGGEFTTASGIATGGLARWNGSQWSQVGGNFWGIVYALEVHGGELIIGGSYPGINGSPNIAKWNGSTYTNLGAGGTNDIVLSLKSSGACLYVGGGFTTAGGINADRAAVWDGSNWSELSGGADASVRALTDYNGEIHAGGQFATVREGTIASPCWAKYHATGILWIAYQPTSRTVDAGENAHFEARAAASYGGLLYQWYKDGVPLANGPTGTGSTIIGAVGSRDLSIQNVSYFDQGGYTLEISNGCGADTSSIATLTVIGPTGVTSPGARARAVVESPAPNPTRGATSIAFTLERESNVNVGLYDVTGRLVRSLDIGSLPAGRHRASWDGRGARGEVVAAGIYFMSLESEGRRLGAQRLVVLR